jgi:hypothetical protein
VNVSVYLCEVVSVKVHVSYVCVCVCEGVYMSL